MYAMINTSNTRWQHRTESINHWFTFSQLDGFLIDLYIYFSDVQYVACES